MNISNGSHFCQRCVLMGIILLACHLQSAAAADIAQDIDKLFTKWDRDDSPGMAVGVFSDGVAVHKRGYGMANLDEGIPISPASVFDTFSVAKSFTTACIARLLDEGKISLDDDIRKYLPELPDYSTPVLIRHLIQCRSGLRDYLNLIMLMGRSRDDVWTEDDALDVITRQKATTFTPGEEHSYNNTDFFLLTLIVERATGQSIREYANEQLFTPLAMRHTFFDDDRTLPLKNRAVGFGRYEDGQFHRLLMNSSTVGPFGLKTTVDDLFKWNESFRQNKLPAGRHLDEFFERGSLLDNENCLSSYPGQKYRGVEHVWYTGGGPGFFAHYVRFPQHDLAIAVLCNLSDEDEWHDIVRIIGQIADILLADHLSPVVANNGWPELAPVQLPIPEVQGRAGGYQKADASFVRIDLRDEGLVLSEINRAFPPSVPTSLTPLSANRFRTAGLSRPFDLIFEPLTEGSRNDVTIMHKNGHSEKWRAVEFANQSDEQLRAYVHDYYCDDLESTYQFFVEGGSLFVRFNSYRQRRLVPTVEDVFVPSTGKWDNMRFVFSRDDDGKVTAFKLYFFRIQLDFEAERKQSEAADDLIDPY